MPKARKKRIPKLSYTTNRNVGYYIAYRDPISGNPRKYKIGLLSRDEALDAYNQWLAAHLKGETPTPPQKGRRKLVEQIASRKPVAVRAEIVLGSLLHITSGLLKYDESRVRPDDAPRAIGTIKRKQYESRRDITQDFLKFINSQYGPGAVARMTLADLTMQDVEAYNALLVQSNYSESQVRKRLQVIKAIIDRGGRPEHGRQALGWNWDSRDVYHGRPDQHISLPTLTQLKLVLARCDAQRTAMVWMAIGLGFGQSDLSVARVGQFDEQSYDMRRGKTGKDRYGEMPRLVWKQIQAYLREVSRPHGELLFLTEKGQPLVHGKTDSVAQWWSDLRDSLGKDGKGLNGFYSLRHLGASEYGSRPGCSIGDMRRWLGHSVSSSVADRYMKPISPEYRLVVEWVRKSLPCDRVNLRSAKN